MSLGTRKVFLLLVLTSFILGLQASSSNLPNYLDERYYISCGTAYVLNLTPPALCNFEHPPFAKYVIGATYVLGVSRYLFALLYALSCSLVFLTVYEVSRSYAVALLPSLLLLLDTVFLNTFRFLLLDPVAVFLSVLGTYLLLVGRLGSSALALGLAVASKLSSAPVLLGALYVAQRRRGIKRVAYYTSIALAVYLATYLADLQLGLGAVVEHHVSMLTYMSWRHGLSLPIASVGFLKLLTRVEVWRYGADVTVVVGTEPGLATYFTSPPPAEYYVVLGVGAGTVLWYTLTPLLLYLTYGVLVGRSPRSWGPLVLISWLSLLNVAAGPIDWYYANTLPYLYAAASLALGRIAGRRFKVVAVPTLCLQATLTALTLLDLLPYRVAFSA